MITENFEIISEDFVSLPVFRSISKQSTESSRYSLIDEDFDDPFPSIGGSEDNTHSIDIESDRFNRERSRDNMMSSKFKAGVKKEILTIIKRKKVSRHRALEIMSMLNDPNSIFVPKEFQNSRIGTGLIEFNHLYSYEIESCLNRKFSFTQEEMESIIG